MYFTLSIISRTSATPVWDAASISCTSRHFPSDISSQLPHGSSEQGYWPRSFFSQFTALATILAVDVFPVPLGPANMRAWAIFSDSMEFLRVSAGNSWPTRSSKGRGRHLRASTL